MKERLVVGFILVFMFSLVVVSAGTCDDSQVIMKLYKSTNSHGALWNEVDYTYDICYDEIFGSRYSGVNPHDCTGTNRILSLSSVTNAHASNERDLIYANDVCYGGLRCEYDESVGSSCSNGGEIVARMYSKYNSHISNADDMNYPIKVCCTDMPSIYWANLNGDEIVDADFGDTVRMVATGSSGTFDIFEDDLINDDEIKTGIVGEVLGGRIIGTWTITQEDLDRADGINDLDNFKFTINGDESEDLKVVVGGQITKIECQNGYTLCSKDGIDYCYPGDACPFEENPSNDNDGICEEGEGCTSADCQDGDQDTCVSGATCLDGVCIGGGSDDPMIIIISSPKCGEYFNESVTLGIEVKANDPDDIIDGKISINGVEVETFTNGGITFDYTFSDGDVGDFQIVVEAVNSREKRSRAISNIMILDKDGSDYVADRNYIAACIFKPRDFSRVYESKVWFDASTTRGIVIDSSGVLDEHIPSEGDIFSWYWEFISSDKTSMKMEKVSATQEKAYRFYWPFPTLGDNLAKLRVELG